METIHIVCAESERDVRIERRFRELNSRGFIRGETSLDQWYLLVNEGWNNTKLPMNEFIRDYLVIMLNRYSTHVDLYTQLSAFNYLAYLMGKQSIEDPSINNIADMCLQSAAFFPGMSSRRHEMKSHQYIIDLGVALFEKLALQLSNKDNWYSQAVKAVSESFGQAIMVLRSTCPQLVKKDDVSNLRKKSECILTDHEANGVAQTLTLLTGRYSKVFS